jgi:acetylornithine deacetylase/succinyl-diaminopimelate desuccinylase-like protein
VGSPEGHDVIRREVAGAACALVLEAGRAADRVITARKGTGSARVVARGVAAHAGNAHDKGANAIWALARFVDRAQGLTDYGRGVTVNVGKIEGGQSKNTVPDQASAAVATGKAAHAGNAHDKGANAIWALARFIDRAQSLTDYARGVTVNAGKVSGGQGKNTVPDQATASLDFRFERLADGEATFAALRAAAAAAAESVPGTAIEAIGGPARLPLERTEPNVALYREYAACARAAGLGDGEAPMLGGGSDASTTATMGIPSIDGLGPRGSGFHTKEELIEVATLVPKAEALARFVAGRVK